MSNRVPGSHCIPETVRELLEGGNSESFGRTGLIDLATRMIIEEGDGGLQARDHATGTVLGGYVNPVCVPKRPGNPDAVRAHNV